MKKFDFFNIVEFISMDNCSDRVVVNSPGGLPSGLDKNDFGIKSVRRNHVISNKFIIMIKDLVFMHKYIQAC